MYNFPIEKYKFFRDGNTIIAVTTYAGKTVKARAKCDPRDEFNEEEGKRIAAERCALKVAKKRVQLAMKKYKLAARARKEAEAHECKMYTYFMDSLAALEALSL